MKAISIQASYYVTKACEGGDMYACAVLGSMHAKGLGVRRNLDNAATYFKKSCDGGEGFGCLLLGKLYEDGFGVNKNYATAKLLLDKSCALGNEEGCKNAKFLEEKQKKETK